MSFIADNHTIIRRVVIQQMMQLLHQGLQRDLQTTLYTFGSGQASSEPVGVTCSYRLFVSLEMQCRIHMMREPLYQLGLNTGSSGGRYICSYHTPYQGKDGITLNSRSFLQKCSLPYFAIYTHSMYRQTFLYPNPFLQTTKKSILYMKIILLSKPLTCRVDNHSLSQLVPVQPDSHTQPQLLVPISVQSPFMHGFGTQSLMSAAKQKMNH